MKKIYLMLACTLTFGFVDAQVVKAERSMVSVGKKSVSNLSQNKKTNNSIITSKSEPIWQDDFSNGSGRVDTLDSESLVQGNGYATATNVSTSGGNGTGLTVDLLVSELTYDLTITNGGTGYITGSDFTVTGGDGTDMILDIVATDAFSLDDATLVPGTGYTTQEGVATTGGSGSDLTVNIEANPIGGVDSLNQATIVGGTDYENLTAVATTTGGSGTGLTVDIYTEAGVIDSVVVNEMGSGYTAGDVITISGGNDDATITVESITNGEITSVSVANAGDGDYLNGETVDISGGGGDNATIEILEVNGGEITEVTITSTGDASYSETNVLTIDGGDNNAELTIDQVIPGGEILDVTINEVGYDYEVGDVVTILAGDEDAIIEVKSVYNAWTLQNTSSPAQNWEITSTWPGIGSFDPPNFVTADNGYALINSDAAGENATQNADLIMTKSIDLSDHEFVALKFSQYMRRWTADSDQYYIGVSIDGGDTWEEIEINTNLGGNTTSANPDIYSLNVSSLVGNEENVKFKFKYIGAWGWFWTVDDIEIIEPEDYDLATSMPNLYAGDMSAWDEELANGVDYYSIPESQISGIDFSANIANEGNLDQTAAMLNVEVSNEGGDLVFEETSAPFALTTSEVTTAFLGNLYTPSELGNYSVKLYGTPDQEDLNPINDTVMIENIVVGGEVYARDNGLLSGGFTNVAGGAGNPFSVGNLFEFFGDFSMSSVDFYVSQGTEESNDVGKLVNSRVYKLEGGELDFVYESQDYQIKEEDRGAFASIPFVDFSGNDATIEASEGDIYLVMIGHYGEDVVISMAQEVNDLSVLFFDGSGELGIFGGMNAVVLRPSSKNYASTKEVSNNFNFKVYPNPASGYTNVAFDLENASKVSFTLTDMSGKTVYQMTEENIVKGKNTFTVPTEGLSNGVYLYNFSAGEKIVNDKLIINK